MLETGKWIRKLFRLVFLEPSEVDDAFGILISLCEQSCKFADYILENCIYNFRGYNQQIYYFVRMDISILIRRMRRIWTKTPSSELCTTKGAESFRAHFNSQFHVDHPCIRIVLQVLIE